MGSKLIGGWAKSTRGSRLPRPIEGEGPLMQADFVKGEDWIET
jgi:hypothetical protein